MNIYYKLKTKIINRYYSLKTKFVNKYEKQEQEYINAKNEYIRSSEFHGAFSPSARAAYILLQLANGNRVVAGSIAAIVLPTLTHFIDVKSQSVQDGVEDVLQGIDIEYKDVEDAVGNLPAVYSELKKQNVTEQQFQAAIDAISDIYQDASFGK